MSYNPSSGGGSGISLLSQTATNTGSSVTIGSIPAGTRRVTLGFFNLSTNGSAKVALQLGTGSWVETSGYGGACHRVVGATSAAETSTTEFVIKRNASGDVYSGILTLIHVGSDQWFISGSLAVMMT